MQSLVATLSLVTVLDIAIFASWEITKKAAMQAVCRYFLKALLRYFLSQFILMNPQSKMVRKRFHWRNIVSTYDFIKDL